MKYENVNTPLELLKYMTENIEYGFVSDNGTIYDDPSSTEWQTDWYNRCTVQDAKTLIKTHYGTCWDQVELERDWFSKHNYKIKTIFMYFDIDKPLPTHTFLIYQENNKYYWFEHSFYINKGIHEFNSEQQLINHVIKEQCKYAKVTIEDKKHITYHEYTKPKPNISVQEFYNHILNQEGEKNETKRV